MILTVFLTLSTLFNKTSLISEDILSKYSAIKEVIIVKKVIFPKSDLKKTTAKKGEAWIRKTYKILVFKKCVKCSSPFLGKKHKCQSCIDIEAEDKKWGICVDCKGLVRKPKRICDPCLENRDLKERTKDCSVCHIKFIVEKGGNKRLKVCDRCKKAKYKLAHKTVLLYFDEDNPLLYLKDPDIIAQVFASVERNIIQSITEFPEFLLDIQFENVDSSKSSENTREHINGMLSTIKKYILECLTDEQKKGYEDWEKHLFQYGCQVITSKKHNQQLKDFQNKLEGIIPREYISIVGRIIQKGKILSIEESINIMKPYFINKGDD